LAFLLPLLALTLFPVSIGVAKEGVSFSVTGDIGSGSTLIKRSGSSDSEDGVTISNDEEVNLTFAIRYLSLFTKATSLATQVKLSMSPEVPLLVNYPIIVDGDEKEKKEVRTSCISACHMLC